jgi:L-histidine N-alpha-methyltransferase
MLLRSEVEQAVRVTDLDLEVRFAEGEEMRTEISDKFRRDELSIELAAAGFDLREWWEDAAGDFALSLSFSAAD